MTASRLRRGIARAAASEIGGWIVAAVAVAALSAGVAAARDALLVRLETRVRELADLRTLAQAYRRLSVEHVRAGALRRSATRASIPTTVELATRRVLRHGTVTSLVPIAGDDPDPRHGRPAPVTRDHPSDQPVELRLTGTSTGELVDLLYELGHGPGPLNVDRLRLRRAEATPPAHAALDVSAVLSRPSPGSPSE
jgi:hypothetical protein